MRSPAPWRQPLTTRPSSQTHWRLCGSYSLDWSRHRTPATRATIRRLTVVFWAQDPIQTRAPREVMVRNPAALSPP